MFKLKILTTVILLSVFSNTSLATGLKIEHVANAGVKISSGEKVILIDALFSSYGPFNFLSNEEFNKLAQEGADVALATHHHGDHFGAQRTAEFLKQSPDSLFIGTPKMLEQLDQKVKPTQLATGKLTGFQSKHFIHNNIKVTAFNFPHMDAHAAQSKNFAYLVEVNGWKVLHVGDGDVNSKVIKGLNLADVNIDIALIHDLFPVRKTNYLELIKKMNPGKVVFVHMTDDKAEPLSKWLKENLPKAGMLVTGYESVHLNK
jgi:L-ascorbate metabolism protein UlaG (beta-lactamase superfamily)